MGLTFLQEMEVLLRHTSNETTTTILADAYLKLVKGMTTCSSNLVEPNDPVLISALGTLAYHFHKYPVYETSDVE